MKNLLVGIVIVGLLASAGTARQWTARSGGFTVEAELVDVKQGNVILQKTDGSQLTVPLSKLSLGDVRYIEETLKAAETRITGQEEAGSTETSQETPAMSPSPQATEPAATNVDTAKLRYAWKEGQSYIYRVKIAAERENSTEEISGNVTYKVNAIREEGIELAVTTTMDRSERREPEGVIIVRGRRIRWRSDPLNTPKNATITIDPQGKVLRIEGKAQLPYVLGDLAQLILEELPAAPQATWTVSHGADVSVIVTLASFHHAFPTEYREGTDATEKMVYTLEGSTGKLITIGKRYELTTTSQVSGKPRIAANGEGKWRFDTERGVPGSADLTMRVTVREKNVTEEIPLQITYRLLSEEELAKEAKVAEEAKKERERPLTEKEITDALADLRSKEATRVTRAAKLLAQKAPLQPNPDMAKALEEVMLTGENPMIRTDAAHALKAWSVPESVPSLLKALGDDWPPVRSAAMETMIKYKPETAIVLVSQQLLNLQTRKAASNFLKAMGSAAEDAVLAHTESSDDWVRGEMCEILRVIGTAKSVPVLEKATFDKSHLVDRPAREALEAIKLRQQLASEAK